MIPSGSSSRSSSRPRSTRPEGLQRRGSGGAASVRSCSWARSSSPRSGRSLVPTSSSQVNDFVDALPGYVAGPDGRPGPARLPRERVPHRRQRVQRGALGGRCDEGARAHRYRPRGHEGRRHRRRRELTIAFLTLFMLLEGPAWMERFYGAVAREKQPRWRAVGSDIYRTIGGYVTGNLADQPDRRHHLDDRPPGPGRPVRGRARASLVAILDLIPLAGATIAAILVTTVAFLDSTTVRDHRAGLLHRLPAAREPRPPAAWSTGGRCSSRRSSC